MSALSVMAGIEPKLLEAAILTSCQLDVLAFKPGNVSVYAEGHGMQADDFLKSASLIAPILSNTKLSLGERIFHAVEQTMQHVKCNTNLGIILLCAPIAQAALHWMSDEPLQASLKRVLLALNPDDARRVYAAIRLANPGGLGQSEQQDVTSEPTVGLIEAMHIARSWDFIAEQHVTDFGAIFSGGLTAIIEYLGLWNTYENALEWAAVGVYLHFLSRYPDSHVQRKHGRDVAEEVTDVGVTLESQFKACENPIIALPLLRSFDNKLKKRGINPGTSADLTVATLLVYHIQNFRWRTA